MTTNLLITGASGRLGKLLSAQLQQAGIAYTSAGRSMDNRFGNHVFMDLATGNGIPEAVAGKDTIVHLASGTKKFDRNIDVEGTQRLIDAAKTNRVAHFVYISIVGIDRVPMNYYQYKLEAEARIKNSGLPYTILRATQFHEFLDDMFRQFLDWPLVVLPRHAQIQPIDTPLVAQKLVDILQQTASNSTYQLGGPEVLELQQLYTSWKQAQQKKARILPLPAIGKTLQALNAGGLTCSEQATGGLTWSQWLNQRYAR